MNARFEQRRRFDAHMMTIALAMARRGLGQTAMNPSVGAVIADEATGEVIARGHTQPGGRPHAERIALHRAGPRARGKTMYVTLEPCAHTGRIPTCADQVATSGIARLVCAITDPNHVIAGRGFTQLREAGVTVELGPLADEAHTLTLGHVLHVVEGRPFVQIKLAVSADGRIATGSGRAPVWITGEVARAHGHLLRAEADAILVGAGTVAADDPSLTCRLPGLLHRSPARVVLDTQLRSPPIAKVFAGNGPRVFIATDAATVPPGLIRLPGTSPLDVLSALDAHAIRRLLIEGGPTVQRAFLATGLVDEVVIYRSAERIAPAGLEPFGANGLGQFASAAWVVVDDRPLGPDRVTIYRRVTA